MKKFFVWVGGAFAVLFVLVGASYAWASYSASSKLDVVFTIHQVDFPVPTPLDAAHVDEGGDPEALALEQAIERGRHLLSARYACADCHGEDFGGGVMVDDPAMGRLLGPNLTRGEGSVTLDYSVADWDRIVRHGIRKDGRPALMPSEDFMAMSDRELSDIIAYIRALPPVDNAVPPSTLGPIGKLLVATG
ncbi:MAG: cytochrome c, partial [Myxococcales bacterium]|nr:cytochrome c [Myxococcales bacterium]